MCRGKHSSNSHIWGSVPFLSCAPIGVCAVDFYLAISHWVIVFHLLTWFLSWRQRQYLLCCLLCAPYLTHTRWTTNIYRGSDTINSPWICPYSAAASIPFQKHWKPSILFKPSPITRIIPLHIQWRTSGCHTHPSSVPYPFLSGKSSLLSEKEVLHLLFVAHSFPISLYPFHSYLFQDSRHISISILKIFIDSFL